MLNFGHMTNNSRYQINEKDIDSMLNYLKAKDPEHATPEMAIELLEYLQATFHTMQHENPDMLAKIYDDFLKTRN